MRVDDSNGSKKAEALPAMDCVLTYKRKRSKTGSCRKPPGESSTMASEQGNGKTSYQKSICNGTNLADRQTRVVNHWRNVLDDIVQSTGFEHDHMVHSCIKMALSRGPLGLSTKLDVKDRHIKEMHEAHSNIQSEEETQKVLPIAYVTSTSGPKEFLTNGFHDSCKDQADVDAITTKCQNVLFDVLISQKFALLCDLLCESFQGSKSVIGVDLSLIITKIKNGIYKESMGLFDKDIQLVWEKFQKIGQEISLLAGSLSTISQASCQKQMSGCSSELVLFEGVHQDIVKEKDSVNLCITSQFTCNNIQSYTKPDKTTDASYLCKLSNCKQCGTEANLGCSLICDGCEAVFHITCIRPAIHSIPKISWYCVSCTNKREFVERDSSANQHDCQHRNCMVCSRLEDSGYQRVKDENPEAVCAISNTRECSDSSIESDDLAVAEPSRTAELHLCKQCGTCEDDDKRFLICSNSHCYYKFYHIRCLKTSQIQNQHSERWYCPSCLCRACLTDRDDELICMCDGCDEAYHTYCMKPPQATVPTGTWYCVKCNMERAKKGMRMYEKLVLRKHGKIDVKIVKGGNGAMDMLANAAKKLRTEDIVAEAIKKSR